MNWIIRYVYKKETHKTVFSSLTKQLEKTPLHLAAMEGHSDIVSLLVEDGANVNACDMVSMHRWTMLHDLSWKVWNTVNYSIAGEDMLPEGAPSL